MYFQVRIMVSQDTKIRRARLTRHSWCVRRTLRREITFLSADWNENLFPIIPQEAVRIRPMPPPPEIAPEATVDFNGFARLR
jgi:hypothetical protein